MNKPVAWMRADTLECGHLGGVELDWEDTGCIPLYTHPVKELTDEEILEVYKNNPFIDGYLNKNLIDFAKAILRKAQDKE